MIRLNPSLSLGFLLFQAKSDPPALTSTFPLPLRRSILQALEVRVLRSQSFNFLLCPHLSGFVTSIQFLCSP